MSSKTEFAFSIQTSKLAHLEDSGLEQAISRTNGLMDEVGGLLQRSSTNWILGTSEPTAFDSHFVTFVARLQDIKRNELIPNKVAQFAEKAMESSELKDVMQGRTTLPPFAK